MKSRYTAPCAHLPAGKCSKKALLELSATPNYLAHYARVNPDPSVLFFYCWERSSISGRWVKSSTAFRQARAKLFGTNEWEYMRQNPELAAIFDDAMTNNSNLTRLLFPRPTTLDLGKHHGHRRWQWNSALTHSEASHEPARRPCRPDARAGTGAAAWVSKW